MTFLVFGYEIELWKLSQGPFDIMVEIFFYEITYLKELICVEDEAFFHPSLTFQLTCF